MKKQNKKPLPPPPPKDRKWFENGKGLVKPKER